MTSAWIGASETTKPTHLYTEHVSHLILEGMLFQLIVEKLLARRQQHLIEMAGISCGITQLRDIS